MPSIKVLFPAPVAPTTIIVLSGFDTSLWPEIRKMYWQHYYLKQSNNIVFYDFFLLIINHTIYSVKLFEFTLLNIGFYLSRVNICLILENLTSLYMTISSLIVKFIFIVGNLSWPSEDYYYVVDYCRIFYYPLSAFIESEGC